MPVSVQIGTETYEIPVPNFATVKKAWKHIQTIQTETPVIEKAEAVLGLISVFLHKTHPELTLEVIEEQLELRQVKDLMASIPAILIDAGIVQPGEVLQPADTKATP